MIQTPRSSFRFLGAAFMNSEMVYSFLMGMGWFFLIGWAVALLVACASVFRGDRTVRLAGVSPEVPGGHLAVKPRVRS